MSDVDEIEVIADGTADVWVVRACEEDEACVVIEHYKTRAAAEDPLVKAINAAFPIPQPPRDEPYEEIHIPGDVWREFTKGK